MGTTSASGPLTQGQVEREMSRLIEAADTVAHDVASRAEDAARAEHAWKIAHARALLSADGPVAVKEARALLVCEDEHLARKIADARLLAAQETSRTIRAQLDALRSVNATVRFATGTDF